MFAVFVTIFMSFLSLFYKKSKFVTVLFFVFLFLLFGWNYWNGDYDAYESLYNFPILEVNTDGYEWGYNGLMILANLWGYQFQHFFIAMALFSLALLFNFIIRYSLYPAFFTFCFLFCFFPLDYVLLRNFIAFTIVLQGLIFLIGNHKFKVFIYVFFVFVASLFHGTSLFYLGLLFCLKATKINILFIFFLTFITTIIFIYSGPDIINIVYGSTGGRDEFYDSSFYRFIYNSSIQVLNLFFINYFYKRSLSVISTSEKERRVNLLVMNINIMLLFVVPLYYCYAIAVRLFRNIAIVNVIFMINIVMNTENKNKKFYLSILLILYLLYFYFSFIQPYFHDTIFSLYKYNLLFDSF